MDLGQLRAREAGSGFEIAPRSTLVIQSRRGEESRRPFLCDRIFMFSSP
jgi:hypothetical protein